MYLFLKSLTILSVGIHAVIYVSVKVIFQLCFAFQGEFIKHYHALLGENLQKWIFTASVAVINSFQRWNELTSLYREVELIPVVSSSAGSQHTEGFKKRWFTMDDRRLMYFKDPLVSGCLPPRHRSPLGRECVCWPEVSPPPPLPGCIRPWRGVHRQQGEQLHRPVGAAGVHAGLPLEPRHHHRHTGQEVPVCLWDGGRAEGLDSRLPEGHQSTNEAAGICRCRKVKTVNERNLCQFFCGTFTLFLVLIIRCK